MLGSIISGIGNIVGGILGNNATEEANNNNIRAQREFAQNGIQWKVADAKAAGIHPLAALGAQTMSFSPSFVGGTSLASGIAETGQNIGRAIDATRDPQGRTDAVIKTMNDLALTRAGLENELLSAQIANIRQAGQGPGIPSVNQAYLVDGQGATARGNISIKPMDRTASGANPAQEPGAINDTGFIRTNTGWMPVMSNDAKQRLEEDAIGTLLWNIRNRFVPSFPKGFERPNVPAELGDVYFDPFAQEYRLKPKHWRD